MALGGQSVACEADGHRHSASVVTGGDRIMGPYGAMEVMQLLNDNFSYQNAARPLQFERTTQTTDEYFMRFDLLRWKVESKMLMGGAFPETCASVTYVRNATLSRPEKLLMLSSVRGS